MTSIFSVFFPVDSIVPFLNCSTDFPSYPFLNGHFCLTLHLGEVCFLCLHMIFYSIEKGFLLDRFYPLWFKSKTCPVCRLNCMALCHFSCFFFDSNMIWAIPLIVFLFSGFNPINHFYEPFFVHCRNYLILICFYPVYFKVGLFYWSFPHQTNPFSMI